MAQRLHLRNDLGMEFSGTAVLTGDLNVVSKTLFLGILQYHPPRASMEWTRINPVKKLESFRKAKPDRKIPLEN